MDSKDVRSWSVSVPGYFSYALILLGWFFLLDVCEKFGPAVLGADIDPFVYIVASWFVLPFLLAGVVGGINNQKLGGLPGGVGGFFKNACVHYLRFVGASMFLLVIGTIVVAVFSSI